MPEPSPSMTHDICIVGGAGHIGLPLALTFAATGQRVIIHDIDVATLDVIAAGKMPFMEAGAAELLTQVLSGDALHITSDTAEITRARNIIITIGTPVDEFHNPSMHQLQGCIEQFASTLTAEHLLVLRSTLYPGTTDRLSQLLHAQGCAPHVAFCPERIVQGRAIEEIQQLPQIISGTTQQAADRARELFMLVAPETVEMQPMEAEFAKLFCNAYRYIQFAASNQFYMIATSAGLDYHRILAGMKHGYTRMRDVPGAGFSAGPCLFKDTMQLSAFYDNEFSLGYTAMLVNEGLPLYVIQHLAKQHDLSQLTVGLLGMAFKANIDDARSSLSYKLKKALSFHAQRVLTTDPFVQDDDLHPLDDVIAESDILILCVPHAAYCEHDFSGKSVVDIWNVVPDSVRMPVGQPV